MSRLYETHGNGSYNASQFKSIGNNVIFEDGVLVFHPETIELGNNIYIGHNSIIKGYHKNYLKIGDGVWIGQQCFFHSAGGITIGNNVGIGPGVKILTSYHSEEGRQKPILHSKILFSPVIIEDGADIGIGAIIMPGVTIGKGAQVGAGAVVTTNMKAYSVSVGVPAKYVRSRP